MPEDKMSELDQGRADAKAVPIDPVLAVSTAEATTVDTAEAALPIEPEPPSIEERIASAYNDTIDRLERNIAMIDAPAFYASAAISLKRIADELHVLNDTIALVITELAHTPTETKT